MWEATCGTSMTNNGFQTVQYCDDDDDVGDDGDDGDDGDEDDDDDDTQACVV